MQSLGCCVWVTVGAAVRTRLLVGAAWQREQMRICLPGFLSFEVLALVLELVHVLVLHTRSKVAQQQ